MSGRVPASCPPNFSGRYTVRSGDTMFLIAQRFGVSLDALIAANSHISNPARIFPDDVLCVPGPVTPPPRVPVSCPPGFQGRYTVQSGDTMFLVAQRFGVSLDALIAANPHISNPNTIFPGDVLCVPAVVPSAIPCCVLLRPQLGIISDALGTAMIRLLATNQRSVSVLATGIPLPSQLGAFNAYQVVVAFPPPEATQFTFFITPAATVPGQPATWAGTLAFVPGQGFTPDTLIVVRPINTATGVTGNAVLVGTLSACF